MQGAPVSVIMGPLDVRQAARSKLPIADFCLGANFVFSILRQIFHIGNVPMTVLCYTSYVVPKSTYHHPMDEDLH